MYFFRQVNLAWQVGVDDEVWSRMECHLHQHKWEMSGSGYPKEVFQLLPLQALTIFDLVEGMQFKVLKLFYVHLFLQVNHAWTLPAFSKDLLLEQRWLIGGTGKACNTLWHNILTVNSMKQSLFLDRSSLELALCYFTLV